MKKDFLRLQLGFVVGRIIQQNVCFERKPFNILFVFCFFVGFLSRNPWHHVYANPHATVPLITTLKSSDSALPKKSFYAFLKPLGRSAGLKLQFQPLESEKNQKPLAAVFVRRPYVWVVLNNYVLPQFRQAKHLELPEGFSRPEIVQRDSKMCVLRMKIPIYVEPSVTYSLKHGWEVQLGKYGAESYVSDPLVTSRLLPSLSTPSMLMVQVEQSNIIRFQDPEHGKDWVVMPTQTTGLSLPGVLRYADFFLLKTVQGVVLEPFTPDLTFQLSTTSINISRPGGLLFSSGQDRYTGRRFQENNKFLNFKAWQLSDLPFPQAKEQLILEVAKVPEEDKLLAQLRLAQFLISHANSAEALGVLHSIESKNNRLKEDVELMELFGVAFYLGGEYGRALCVLSNPNLPPEVEIWKGAAMIALGLGNNGILLMEKHFPALQTYPDPLKALLALRGAGAFVLQKNQTGAQKYMNLIKDSTLTSVQENQLRGFQKDSLHLLNPQSNLIGILSNPTNAYNAKQKILEAFQEIKHLYTSNQLSLKASIQRLEDLNFAWRGGQPEFLVLQELSKLYQADKRFADSLETYEKMIQFFPNYPEIPRLKEEAKEVFKKGLSATNPMFRRIAFFDRFEEFLPQDDSRIMILENLTNDLLGLDLPTQAVNILEKEVQQRGQKISLKLLISLGKAYLHDHKPDQALGVLDQRYFENTQLELQLQGNYLRTLAFYEKGDLLKAQQCALRQDDADMLLLRADIHWALKAWDQVARDLELLIQVSKKPTPKIILYLAMALYQSGQLEKIHALEKAYGNLMKQTQYESCFNMLTHGDIQHLNTFNIQKALRQVNDFEKFKDFLKKKPAS